MKVTCEGCGQPVECQVEENPQILNHPSMSVLVLSHAKSGYCFNCKSQVAVFLRGANLVLAARHVSGPKSSIVVAPASALPEAKR